MVPEGWKANVSMKELLRLDRGSSPRPIKDYVTEKGGVNWIKIGDTVDGQLTIEQTKEKITPKGAMKSRAVSKGELIVSNSMSYGKPYILGIDGYIHDGWFVLRGYEKHLEKNFLIQLLSSSLIQRQYKRLAAGGVVSNISSDLVYSVRVNLPPIDEQKKIAQILCTWDKAITTTEQLLANRQQQKKALMQQLLTGKKRLLDENGVRFSRKWERVELGNLLDYRQPTPYLVKRAEYDDNFSTPVLTAGKTFILGYTNEESGIFKENLPCIIFDDFTTDSKFVDFPFKAKSSAMKILTAKNSVSIKFVFESMQMLNFKVGGHQRHWISIFSNLVIPVPTFKEQQRLATVLSVADREIKAIQQKLEALKQEKKALMQQLLTGKRRVKVDEEAA